MLDQHIYRLIDQYVDAKEIVINEGYSSELDWQLELDIKTNTESDFLREAAWVILSSGMRETTVRSKFNEISDSFMGFESALNIVYKAYQCRSDALKYFNHPKKIDAILSVAFRVFFDGFESVKNSIEFYGVDYLQSLDFIGPATSYHLAKNIGLNVAKPDRHLCRVAEATGFNTVNDLCNKISSLTGDSISVVDLVIWRFATIRNDYLSWFEIKH